MGETGSIRKEPIPVMQRCVVKSKLPIVFLLLLSAIPASAQKTRFGQTLPKARTGADFPLKLHLFATHIRSYCQTHEPVLTREPNAGCIDVIYADVLLNGRKIELRTDSDVYLDPFRPLRLPLGDYKARLGTASQDPATLDIDQKVDLLLQNNAVLRSTVTGVSE